VSQSDKVMMELLPSHSAHVEGTFGEAPGTLHEVLVGVLSDRPPAPSTTTSWIDTSFRRSVTFY